MQIMQMVMVVVMYAGGHGTGGHACSIPVIPLDMEFMIRG